MLGLDQPEIVARFGLEQRLIELCYDEAEIGLHKGEVPVGCVLVRLSLEDSSKAEVLATGHNRTNELKSALKHAEMECMREVIQRYPHSYAHVFSQTIVLLTIEPCIMCCSWLRRFNFVAVLYGAANDRFGGAGSIYPVHSHQQINLKPLECFPALDSAKAIGLLQRFYEQTNSNAPKHKVIVKTKKRAREE